MAKEVNAEERNDSELYLVGIGASAGGLEAIQEFFDNMPATDNVAFVIVQHLSSEHKSLLVELVARHTQLKVAEAQDMLDAEPYNVYVIPNNKILTIERGKLRLSDKSQMKAPNTAIDKFLESLADDQGLNAIAVILSGTGTDGSRGIQSVQESGGMVIVQDPETAKFNGMPNSAIATGCADFILAPKSMPRQILEYLKHKPMISLKTGSPDASLLPEVFALIERHCGYDFTNYKTSTILRRISRRMGMLGFSTFHDYFKVLKESAEECRFIGKEFLIGVTQFFRDYEAFESLSKDALAQIVKKIKHHELLKVWVTACSTGEEAYSIAMLLDDMLQQYDKTVEVKIFASDIDSKAVEFASKGTYPLSSMRNVPQGFYERYFIVENGFVTIIPRLRKQIVFAHHNLLKDPPFIKNHLVTCRNMLIYVNNVLQEKAIANFLFSLNKDGYLFLGPSEVLVTKDGFEEVNAKWKIFRKVADGPKFRNDKTFSPPRYRYEHAYNVQTRKTVDPNTDLQQKLKNILIEQYGFLAVYVDQNLDIKDATGNLNRYLSLPEKFGTLNILNMVRKDLSISLGAAIRSARKEKRIITIRNIRTAEGKPINIRVDPNLHNEYYFILIHDYHEEPQSADLNVHHSPDAGMSTRYVSELEEDLRQTRMELQMAVENSETANEELQSSNEELLSANEELQSSNEELQSLNEELHTLNTEHQARIKELTELNDDLDNYFRSTDLAQIFLDKRLYIRKFNPLAVKMINLIPDDIGRPLAHISTNIRNDRSFLEDIHQVLKTNQVLEREVQMTNGQIWLMRIFPFVRKDKDIDGAVVTFIDVTNIKELNTIVKSVFNATLSAIMAFKAVRDGRGEIHDFEMIISNDAADTLLKRAPAKDGKIFLKACLPGLADDNLVAKYKTVISSGKSLHTEVKLQTDPAEWFAVIISPMMDGMVINLTNITERRLAEDKFLQNHQELIKTKESYRKLNVELEENVKERTAELASSEERFRLISGVTSDAIWDRDLQTGAIWWSDSFYFWFGYENNAEVNTVSFFESKIHPEDLCSVKEAINDAIGNGSEWSINYRFADSKGNYISVSDKGMVLKDKKTPYRLVGAITDITAQEVARENELLKVYKTELEELVKERTFELEAQKEILFNLLMQAPALICTLKGPDHIYDLVNPSYQRLFGERNIVGLPIRKALPELEGQGIFDVLDEVYNTGKPYVGREVKLRLAKNKGMVPEDIFFNFIYQP
ncbi:MAG: chemotaxis protein CheB, partial [Chryseosolibacter sp.]